MQEEDIIECMLMSGVMVHTNVQILIVNKSHNRVSDIIRQTGDMNDHKQCSANKSICIKDFTNKDHQSCNRDPNMTTNETSAIVFICTL